MNNNTAKGPITVLGIDLAKQSFQLHGVDKDGQAVLKKKLNRKQLSAFVANLPICLIGLEACGGSHHWVRAFTEMGHSVRMMAPQFVNPMSNQTKMMPSMQKRFAKPFSNLICVLYRLKVLNNKISRACTALEASWLLDGRLREIRYEDC